MQAGPIEFFWKKSINKHAFDTTSLTLSVVLSPNYKEIYRRKDMIHTIAP